jgi:hypothetical protein
MAAATRNKALGKKLCECIKKVRRTVKLRKTAVTKGPAGLAKESAAIGICVKSVLQTRGKTLKRFSCDKQPKLTTQPFSPTKARARHS